LRVQVGFELLHQIRKLRQSDLYDSPAMITSTLYCLCSRQNRPRTRWGHSGSGCTAEACSTFNGLPICTSGLSDREAKIKIRTFSALEGNLDSLPKSLNKRKDPRRIKQKKYWAPTGGTLLDESRRHPLNSLPVAEA